jgi:pimeloyl-ACP methyl ester carboxylesterase
VAYTHKMRFGAFRGFGVPQVTFASEQQIDAIARQLDIDPMAMRRLNIKRDGDRWFGGQGIFSNGLADCLDVVERESGWKAARAARLQPAGAPAPEFRRGMGLAVSAHISGLLATGAIVRMLEDGTVLLNTGAVDIGQGSNTALTQICAQALQVPVDRVAIASPDTDGSPYNWGTTASRITYMTGRSVVAAAAEVEKQLRKHAGAMLECAEDDLELRAGGNIGIKGVPGGGVSFAQISGYAHWAAGGPIIGSNSWVFDQKTVDPKRAVALGLPFGKIGIFSFSAQVIEVEVDTHEGFEAFSPAQRQAFVDSRRAPLLAGKEPRDIADAVARSLVGPNARPEHLQQLVDSIAALHKDSYIKSLQATVEQVVLGDISSISAPAHFIVGAEDSLTPVAMHHEMAAKMGGAPVSVLPRAGHLSNIENPDAFNAAAMAWLRPRAALAHRPAHWPA